MKDLIKATIAKAYNDKGTEGINEITQDLCKMIHQSGIASTVSEANELAEQYILDVVK